MENAKLNRQSFIKKWAPLFVMGLAIIIIVLDTTLLNVSLGTIVRELKTNISSLQWVITAYSLTLAALTITGGRLGDLFGRKKMFMLGAVIFAIGSLIASLSKNVGWLIIGESIIEGIGAALMMPATASLLVSTYKGRDRALALGIWGGMAAAGSAIGPVLGGYLTSHYSWRWGFRINVFVAAILIIGSIIIKEARDNEEKPAIDWFGVMLTATGLFSGVFAIIQGSSLGWWAAKQPLKLGSSAIKVGSLSVVPFALFSSVFLLTIFVFWEKRLTKKDKTPLVNMKIFTNKQFTGGALTSMIMSLGQVGLIFGLPVFLQGVRGLDALHTGYAMLPLSAGLLIMAPTGGVLTGKFLPKRIVQTGLLINVVGLTLLRFMIKVDASTTSLILPLAIYGSGMGLCMSQLSNLTLSAVSSEESGEASGVNNTLRQIGSSLGTAIIGSILVVTLGSAMSKSVRNSSIIQEQNKQIVASEIVGQSSAVEFGGSLKTTAKLNQDEKVEIKTISNASTVHANKTALLFTIIFTSLAIIPVSLLPKSKDIEKNQSLAAH